jgi:hypothetical protein
LNPTLVSEPVSRTVNFEQVVSAIAGYVNNPLSSSSLSFPLWIASGLPVIPAQYALEQILPNPLGVLGANMGYKLFVALQLEVAHHFIERFAGGRTRGFEPPATFGATKTLQTLLLNPYQLPAHCRICSCAPRSTRLLSKDETFRLAIDGSFRSGVLPDCITLSFIGISTFLTTQESA